jgi:hypothetical protein
MVGLGVRHVFTERVQRRREVEYQKALRSYSEVLKTGMTRKRVEDYLSARNLPFRQMPLLNAIMLILATLSAFSKYEESGIARGMVIALSLVFLVNAICGIAWMH